ncbi:MAG: DUF177 domain-containing protein [Scytolyngbya sp. HA4215-MV1]|nr:DUF177 domain-containing protein [Scytolyngbya sp. HA4215-MV1]
MEAIHIPQLIKAPARTETISFREMLPDLETLTPVQGRLQVIHQGQYLEVSVRAETIITLTCHRCLKQYNHRLSLETTELIWLEDPAAASLPYASEREVSVEDLVETLSPTGYFDPTSWLYEQLCLEIPPRQLCDEACSDIPQSAQSSEPNIDRRWASLQALKQQFPS